MPEAGTFLECVLAYPLVPAPTARRRQRFLPPGKATGPVAQSTSLRTGPAMEAEIRSTAADMMAHRTPADSASNYDHDDE